MSALRGRHADWHWRSTRCGSSADAAPPACGQPLLKLSLQSLHKRTAQVVLDISAAVRQPAGAAWQNRCNPKQPPPPSKNTP